MLVNFVKKGRAKMEDKEQNPSIKITHLGMYEKRMLEKMWSIKSIKEYDEWSSQLSNSDQRLKKSLENMLVMAMLDQELETYLIRNNVDPYPEANQILKKFTLNN